MLSAQTTDKKVNQVTPTLFKYANTPEKMASLKVNKIENPRIEKEKHFYNAKHSNLEKLGLKPLKLSEDVVIDIANYCQKFKKNIDTKTIIPKVKWQ